MTNFAHAAFLENFLRFMAFSLRRNVPVVQFLESFLATHYLPVGARGKLEAATEGLRSGQSFSEALGEAKALFPDWVRLSIEAGERGGNLPSVAAGLQRLQARRLRLMRAVEHDWSYPAFLAAAIAVFLSLFFCVVLPDMARTSLDLMAHREGGAPWTAYPLRFVAGMGDLPLPVSLGLCLLILIGASTAYARTRPQAGGTRNLVRYLPYYGSAQADLEISGFCEFVAGLLRHGILLQEALRMSACCIGDERLRDEVLLLAEEIERGIPLPTAVTAREGLPSLLQLHLTVGMTDQTIIQSLEELSEHFHNSAGDQLRKAQSVSQPIVILLVGGVVGLLWLMVFAVLFSSIGVL